jgi:hypothetical protein
MSKKPKFEDTLPIEGKPAIEDTSPIEEQSFLSKAANVLDIGPSLMRTGVEAAISPEREVIPSLKQQFQRTLESPTTATGVAPTGSDINKALTENIDILKPLPGEEKKERSPILEAIGGFTTESALQPSAWFASLPKVNKVARIPIISAADRQAAKALSQYATKSDVISKGKDISIAGARLVSEDLQGLLKSPEKLYEKIAGTTKITKTIPQGLKQPIIKSGVKKQGLIGEIAKNVDNVIETVQKDYDVKPILPAGVMYKQLLENSKKNLSKISGEKVDLDKMQTVLEDALKPFEYTEIPSIGNIPKGMDVTTSTITLPELQRLRKNIGKQVSDLTFYAAADKNVALEKETLAEVYRQLGDVIKSQLEGKKVSVGSKMVDAKDFYELQNNRMKQLMDVESLLEFTPTEKLKETDLAGTLASMATQGTVMGGMGLAGSMLNVPYSSTAALVGAGYGMAGTAAKAVKESTPELLSDILKQASKVPVLPYAAGLAPIRGAIQYARQGEFVPTLGPGREPQSVGLTPKQLVNYKIPRSTQGILEQKDKVLAKLAQSGAPSEMIDTIAQALNGDPEELSNVAPLLMMQSPQMFEKSKYKVFDGKFLDPNDKAKAADDISKRDDLDSIQRARMINKINKFGEVPEGL